MNTYLQPPAARALLTLLLLSPLLTVAQQHEPVPLYDDLGNHEFPISSTVPLVQDYFNQGIRLYYGFNHAEAVRAFREAQRLDPDCAICWWGESLSWGPNINLPMDESAATAAFNAAQQAKQKAAGASPKEQALIRALELRYSANPQPDRLSLDIAYSNAMSDVVDNYGQDMDIRVLYGESLMTQRPWDYWQDDGTPATGIDVALEHLEYAMKVDQNHPGACHFYIHAVEAIYPERALPCAERLAMLMPGAGHLVHMPGHIYIRVGRYLDAVAANEHAVHADETYIMDQHPGMGMYTAGYYPHNYDFMAFAAMMIGRSHKSVASAQKVTSLLPAEMFGTPGMDFLQHWAVRPLLMQVRFGHWDELLAASQPPVSHSHSRALWHYARGRGFVGKNNLVAARRELGQLREIARSNSISDLKMEFNYSTDLLAIAEQILYGWIEAKSGYLDSAITAMENAVTLEDNLLYGEPPEWSVPARQDLGAVLLLAQKWQKAETIFREDLGQFPENGWSLYGLTQALKEQGMGAEAEQTSKVLDNIWRDADVRFEKAF